MIKEIKNNNEKFLSKKEKNQKAADIINMVMMETGRLIGPSELLFGASQIQGELPLQSSPTDNFLLIVNPYEEKEDSLKIAYYGESLKFIDSDGQTRDIDSDQELPKTNWPAIFQVLSVYRKLIQQTLTLNGISFKEISFPIFQKNEGVSITVRIMDDKEAKISIASYLGGEYTVNINDSIHKKFPVSDINPGFWDTILEFIYKSLSSLNLLEFSPDIIAISGGGILASRELSYEESRTPIGSKDTLKAFAYLSRSEGLNPIIISSIGIGYYGVCIPIGKDPLEDSIRMYSYNLNLDLAILMVGENKTTINSLRELDIAIEGLLVQAKVAVELAKAREYCEIKIENKDFIITIPIGDEIQEYGKGSLEYTHTIRPDLQIINCLVSKREGTRILLTEQKAGMSKAKAKDLLKEIQSFWIDKKLEQQREFLSIDLLGRLDGWYLKIEDEGIVNISHPGVNLEIQVTDILRDDSNIFKVEFIDKETREVITKMFLSSKEKVRRQLSFLYNFFISTQNTKNVIQGQFFKNSVQSIDENNVKVIVKDRTIVYSLNECNKERLVRESDGQISHPDVTGRVCLRDFPISGFYQYLGNGPQTIREELVNLLPGTFKYSEEGSGFSKKYIYSLQYFKSTVMISGDNLIVIIYDPKEEELGRDLVKCPQVQSAIDFLVKLDKAISDRKSNGFQGIVDKIPFGFNTKKITIDGVGMENILSECGTQCSALRKVLGEISEGTDLSKLVCSINSNYSKDGFQSSYDQKDSTQWIPISLHNKYGKDTGFVALLTIDKYKNVHVETHADIYPYQEKLIREDSGNINIEGVISAFKNQVSLVEDVISWLEIDTGIIWEAEDFWDFEIIGLETLEISSRYTDLTLTREDHVSSGTIKITFSSGRGGKVYYEWSGKDKRIMRSLVMGMGMLEEMKGEKEIKKISEEGWEFSDCSFSTKELKEEEEELLILSEGSIIHYDQTRSGDPFENLPEGFIQFKEDSFNELARSVCRTCRGLLYKRSGKDPNKIYTFQYSNFSVEILTLTNGLNLVIRRNDGIPTLDWSIDDILFDDIEKNLIGLFGFDNAINSKKTGDNKEPSYCKFKFLGEGIMSAVIDGQYWTNAPEPLIKEEDKPKITVVGKIDLDKIPKNTKPKKIESGKKETKKIQDLISEVEKESEGYIKGSLFGSGKAEFRIKIETELVAYFSEDIKKEVILKSLFREAYKQTQVPMIKEMIQNKFGSLIQDRIFCPERMKLKIKLSDGKDYLPILLISPEERTSGISETDLLVKISDATGIEPGDWKINFEDPELWILE